MEANENAAYTIAMAVGAMIEAMGMAAENTQRLQQGKSLAYGEEAFNKLRDDNGLHHNALMAWFHP